MAKAGISVAVVSYAVTRLLVVVLTLTSWTALHAEPSEPQTPLMLDSDISWDGGAIFRISDLAEQPDHEADLILDDGVAPAQLLFQPPVLPSTTVVPTIRQPAANRLVNQPAIYLSRRSSKRSRISLASYSGLDISVSGQQSKVVQASDIGDLLGKVQQSVGVRKVTRQPIIHQTRIRGSRDSQSNKSGSYWVPARLDLDTALSKIDSRLIQDVIVIKGPYSAFYGPGFDFVDFSLLPSPRYNGFDYHAVSSIDFQSNGSQLDRRQTVMAGDSDSGFRMSYGHKSGSDYDSGDGTEIPASYTSRDFNFTYGVDLTPHSSLEFNALRLDQTDVELPGQAFDIDYLVTDAYELGYVNELVPFSDRFELSTWYNRTELAGNAQRAGKRRQFPVYDAINFVGNTDVDSMSTGYTAVWSWLDERSLLSVGTDLRFVRQELNEITSGDVGIQFWRNRNSPIPQSHQSNPGLFAQHTQQIGDDVKLTSGARLDWVSSNVEDDEDKLADVTVRQDQENALSLGEILGSDSFDRDFALGAAFFLAEIQLTQSIQSTVGYAYAERAPSLTELYAAESFMFLLQNGLNTVTGDPELDKERLWQFDIGVSYDDGRLRSGLNGFHAWIRDYITFENMDTFVLGGTTEQSNLKYVNTDLATLAGGELFAEFESSPWLTTFATLSYVEGRDHSRNGNFATQEPNFNTTIPSVGSQQIAGRPRGDFSGIAAADEEPLPSIGPMEARLGLRLHDTGTRPRWGIELSARVVNDQGRVATSLRESATPEFTIWDLRGFARPRPSFLVVAGVENFTDKQYREYLDFRPQRSGALSVYQPGVNFYVGSEFAF